jgi:hypothetical protein
MSFQAKQQEVQNTAVREIEKCAMDYQANRYLYGKTGVTPP